MPIDKKTSTANFSSRQNLLESFNIADLMRLNSGGVLIGRKLTPTDQGGQLIFSRKTPQYLNPHYLFTEFHFVACVVLSCINSQLSLFSVISLLRHLVVVT